MLFGEEKNRVFALSRWPQTLSRLYGKYPGLEQAAAKAISNPIKTSGNNVSEENVVQMIAVVWLLLSIFDASSSEEIRTRGGQVMKLLRSIGDPNTMAYNNIKSGISSLIRGASNNTNSQQQVKQTQPAQQVQQPAAATTSFPTPANFSMASSRNQLDIDSDLPATLRTGKAGNWNAVLRKMPAQQVTALFYKLPENLRDSVRDEIVRATSFTGLRPPKMTWRDIYNLIGSYLQNTNESKSRILRGILGR